MISEAMDEACRQIEQEFSGYTWRTWLWIQEIRAEIKIRELMNEIQKQLLDRLDENLLSGIT